MKNTSKNTVWFKPLASSNYAYLFVKYSPCWWTCELLHSQTFNICYNGMIFHTLANKNCVHHLIWLIDQPTTLHGFLFSHNVPHNIFWLSQSAFLPAFRKMDVCSQGGACFVLTVCWCSLCAPVCSKDMHGSSECGCLCLCVSYVWTCDLSRIYPSSHLMTTIRPWKGKVRWSSLDQSSSTKDWGKVEN